MSNDPARRALYNRIYATDLDAIRRDVEDLREYARSRALHVSDSMNERLAVTLRNSEALLAENERLRADVEKLQSMAIALVEHHTGPDLAAKIRRFNSTGEK